MDGQKPFNWGLYEKVFNYFEKNPMGSISQISRNLGVSPSDLYEPLQRIERELNLKKIFPTDSEAYFLRNEKNA